MRMTTDEQRPSAALEVVLGVDTHLDAHAAVALDHHGRRLGALSLPTTEKGYEELLLWAKGFGPVRCVGVEGTSSYGAGVARHLTSRGIEVLEVERPKRRQRSTSRRNLAASPITPTLRPPLGSYWRERRRVCPRAATAVWR